MQKIILLAASLLLILSACQKDEDEVDLSGEVFGPELAMGNGKAKSFVEKDEFGIPISIGLKFDAAALVNLPTGEPGEFPFMLELPAEIAVPPFNHLSFDWNEHGHEPIGVYNVPHFDVHFYFISMEERQQILATDSVQFANKPDLKYLPENYFQVPGGEPMMGTHWVDANAPELNGAAFTQTFVYGTYDGEVNFIEPMVALTYLQSKPVDEFEVAQPQVWQKEGYYPKKMIIQYNEARSEYTIALTGLQIFK